MNHSTHSFDCPRTCRFFERRDWCRFNVLFKGLGITSTITSHTATVKVSYENEEALKAAVERLGGTWLGSGEHSLYENAETGLGFKLPRWNYPIVIRKDGTMAYDDYNGSWGNVKDFEALSGYYSVEGVRMRAAELGWAHSEDADALTVFHPAGGTITVNNAGELATQGFVGNGCHDATEELLQGIGERTQIANTEEAYAAQQQINQGGE